MELARYLAIARRRWWLLVLGFSAGSAIAIGLSVLVAPTYRATTVMLVVQQQTPGMVQLNDLQASERLANTFSRMVKLRPVMERAIAVGRFGITPEELARRIRVTNPRSTQLLEISATASAGSAARDIANTVADAFIEFTRTSDLGSRAGNVLIVERAVAPLSPQSAPLWLNVALGATLGLLLSAAVALAVEYLDDTVKSTEEVGQVSGLTTIGEIEQFSGTKEPTEQLVAANSPRSSLAEEYRSARTNLLYAIDLEETGKLVLVTSPGSGEGKSTTASNLAVVFGFAGYRVAVLDADLRRPSLHRIFGMRNGSGLSTALLTPGSSLQEVTRTSPYANVSVITSGPIPPNPSELLGSMRMGALLDEAKARFDLVLVDSPPALDVTDAVALATLCDASLLVVRSRHTRSESLRSAVTVLAQAGRPIVGAILNRSRKTRGYYQYGRRSYEDRAPSEQRSSEDVASVNLLVNARGSTTPDDAARGPRD